MRGPLTADELYGRVATAQPSASGVAEHAVGEPEPTMRTQPRPADAGLLGNPIFVLVALVGLAVLLLNISITGEVRVQG